MTTKSTKVKAIKSKRLSKGKRIHARRLKAATRKSSGTPQI